MTDHLTLDTNVLRDWAWAERRSHEVRHGGDESKRNQLLKIFTALREWRDMGRCDFAVTTQLYTDYGGSADQVPSFIRDMIGDFLELAVPSLFMFPLVFPAAFADVADLQRILDVVFPGSGPFEELKGDSRKGGKRKDVLQLYAHKTAGRDRFLTSDKAILRARGALAAKCGITATSLDEYGNEVLSSPSLRDGERDGAA